jgi:membrane-bound lytic murein transglycosylase D
MTHRIAFYCLILSLVAGCAALPRTMAPADPSSTGAATHAQVSQPAEAPGPEAAKAQAPKQGEPAAGDDTIVDAEGDDLAAEKAFQEEPLVNEELPEANPDAVLASGTPQADRFKEQAQEIEKEIKKEISFDIPIVQNERVAYFLDYFRTAVRGKFSSWLARSTIYLPRMQEIFREQGLPEDLVYLALIESGFNPRATSRSAAVGTWQFISGTGRRYGLRQNFWVDERRDVEKATYAAAAYLTDLYSEFGSWYLAAAAYNCGEGRIRQVIRRCNTEDFWEICDRQALVRETRDYVPKMIAAILIAKEPEKYGFGDICYESPPDWESVELDRPASLSLIANLCGSDCQILKDLNPELRRNWVPPARDGAYRVRIPAGSKELLLAGLAENKEKALVFREHLVRRGETLRQIARAHRCSPRSLAAVNDIHGRLVVGQRLVIPSDIGSPETRALAKAVRSEGTTKTCAVRRGETATRVARRCGISLASLKKLNPGMGKRLHAGQRLVIRKAPVAVASKDTPEPSTETARPEKGSARKTYAVHKGDTLYGIAKRNGLTVAGLKELNPGLERLKAGQRVVVAGTPQRTLACKEAPKEAPEGGAGAGGERAAKPAATGVYTARKGDTIYHIARSHGISVAALKELNPSLGRKLKVGQRLIVAAAASDDAPKAQRVASAAIRMASADEPARTQRLVNYLVKPGDTLWKIARRYNVEINNLRNWNGLGKNEGIRPGDRLKLKMAGNIGG